MGVTENTMESTGTISHSNAPAASPNLLSFALQADLIELLPSAVYLCSADGTITACNKRAVELWGREPALGDRQEKFCGSFRLHCPDGTPLAHADTPMARVLRSGEPERDQEVVIERPDGRRVFVLVNINPLRDGAGNLVGAISSIFDITERKRAEQVLEGSERHARELLEVLPAAIYTTDAEGRITFYNKAATELWGCRPELGSVQWCGSWRLYWPDGRPMPHDECPMAVALKEQRAVRGAEAIAERPDGTRVPFHPYPTPLRDDAGRLVGTVNMLVDVSERMQAEAEATRMRQDLGDFFENGAVALHIVDGEGTILEANRAELDLLGYAAEEYIGRNVGEFHVDKDAVLQLLERLKCGEQLANHPAELRAKDGSTRHVLISSNAQFRDGAFVHTRCFTIDVTEQRKMQSRLEVAKEAGGVGTFDRDLISGSDYVSDSYWRLFGVAPGAFQASLKGWLSRVLKDDRRRAMQDLRKALHSGTYETEYRVVWPNGEIRHISGRGRTERGPDGRPRRLVGAFVDVTELRQADAALRARTAELEAVMENVPVVVWLAHGRDAKRIYSSRYGAELFRMPPGANQSKTADAAEMPTHFRILRDGIELPGSELPVQRAARGEKIQDEEVEIGFDDGAARSLLINASPLLDPDGNSVGAVAAAVDITERKRSEERQKLIMAELDHRVRNTLAVVRSMLFISNPRGLSSQAFAKAVAGRIDAMANAHGLLTASGWRGASLLRLVNDGLAAYRSADLERVRVSGPDLLLRPSAAVSVALVIHELSVNAAKYGALSAPDGHIAVFWKVERTVVDVQLRLQWIESGGPRVTAPSQTGFGSRMIDGVLQHEFGGVVSREYAPDGLRFEAQVPWDRVASDDATPPTKDAAAVSRSAGPDTDLEGARILIVEDNPILALGLSEILSGVGVDVVGPVGRLEEAMALAMSTGVDGALLDISLHGVQVFPLADMLAERKVPFAFVTGYDRRAVIPERFGNVPALQKPAPQGAAVRLVEELLAGERSPIGVRAAW